MSRKFGSARSFGNLDEQSSKKTSQEGSSLVLFQDLGRMSMTLRTCYSSFVIMAVLILRNTAQQSTNATSHRSESDEERGSYI